MCVDCAQTLKTIMWAQFPKKQSKNPNQAYALNVFSDFMCSAACKHAFTRWYKGKGWENEHPESGATSAKH